MKNTANFVVQEFDGKYNLEILIGYLDPCDGDKILLLRDFTLHMFMEIWQNYKKYIHCFPRTKYLTAADIELIETVKQDERPISDVSLQLYHQIILESFMLNIENMKLNDMIPKMALELLLDEIDTMVGSFIVGDAPAYLQFFQLTSSILKLLLQSLVPEQLSGRTLKCSLWGIMDSYLRSSSPVEFDAVYEHIRILLVYRCVDINKNLDRYTLDWDMDNEMADLVFETCISIMPQSEYKEYQQQQAELNHSVTEEDEISSESFDPRTLQELCRITIWESIPAGKIPVAVQTLPIPKRIQLYISLDVTPE